MKYGKNKIFNPDKLHSKNIDRQTVKLIPKNAKVLEIGCATGFMGEYLIQKKGCRVTGVDIRKAELQIAQKRLTHVIYGDIENREVQKQIHEKFDVIVASALIQHMKDPQETLMTWKKFLKKSGFLVITASNIAHWTTRFALLRGKFEYTEYGLLDNTHLRFFTIDTFKKLLIDSGYTIDYFSIDAVGGGYPKVSRALSYLFPGLFTYQMVIKATP